MTYSIAFAGKGGVGKTTLCALTASVLSTKGLVLAIDADPNSNLGEKLGIAYKETIGGMREDMLKEIEKIPIGMSKQEYIELRIRELIAEGEKIDLLVMGRPEGKGCYCYVNSILRNNIDILSGMYRYVVMDNEAGLEHLSRRTTRNVDLLIIVSDATKQGLETAKRIFSLSEQLELSIGKRMIVANMVENGKEDWIKKVANEKGIELHAIMPFDKELSNRVADNLPVSDYKGPVHEAIKKKILSGVI